MADWQPRGTVDTLEIASLTRKTLLIRTKEDSAVTDVVAALDETQSRIVLLLVNVLLRDLLDAGGEQEENRSVRGFDRGVRKPELFRTVAVSGNLQVFGQSGGATIRVDSPPARLLHPGGHGRRETWRGQRSTSFWLDFSCS